MISLVEAFPFILGILLIMTGLIMTLIRTKGNLHIEGIVTDIARITRRKAKVTVTLEAPVVRYKIGDNEYCGVAAKYMADGILDLGKGKKIKIRVNRKNHRRFVPEESGGIVEKLIISGGIFMIIANIVILLRYGI